MDTNEHSLDWFISNQLKKKQPCALYHYCNEEAASSIRKTGVYCTNSKYLDDRTECKLGWDFAKKILTATLEKKFINDIDDLRKKSAIRFWTFSLCENPNSSHMRKNYGEPWLRFKYNEVHQQITKLMQKDLMEPLQHLHFILPCFYLNVNSAEERNVKQIKALCSFIFGVYLNDSLINLHNGDEKKKLQIATACSLMLDSMIKEGKFKNEQEWRVIVITFDDESVNCCKFGGKCRLYSGLSYRPSLNFENE